MVPNESVLRRPRKQARRPSRASPAATLHAAPPGHALNWCSPPGTGSRSMSASPATIITASTPAATSDEDVVHVAALPRRSGRAQLGPCQMEPLWLRLPAEPGLADLLRAERPGAVVPGPAEVGDHPRRQPQHGQFDRAGAGGRVDIQPSG